MGKLKDFDICFDDNKYVYLPGEQVKGSCVIRLNDKTTIRALRVTIKGEATVRWSETRGSGEHQTTEYYFDQVKYFSHKVFMLGTDLSESREVLTEGLHKFPFQFSLPVNIPTSFKGIIGNIRYWLKAVIDKPWKFNHRTEKDFKVICPIDINELIYRNAVVANVAKTVCCWCCKSEPITISVQTDRAGYFPGESIAISAEFENLSSRSITPKATLRQTQTFFAGGKSRFRKKKFTVITGPPIKRFSRMTWDAQLLPIPADVILKLPTINNCRIISVAYYIKVTLHIQGATKKCAILPITIGTVPFVPDPPPTQSAFISTQPMPLPSPHMAPSSSNDPRLPMWVGNRVGEVGIGGGGNAQTHGHANQAFVDDPPAYTEIDLYPIANSS